MTTRQVFRAIMAQRREAESRATREYLTRAARKMVWIMRGVPVDQWGME